MSFSLSVSGHVDNATQALEVDEIVRTKAAELVEAVRAAGVEPSSASFSGPSGSVNLLAAPVEDAASSEADLEE